MTFEEPPATPKLRLVGIVWGAVGVVALIVGLVSRLSAVAIFGGLALVLGIVVYAAQSYREASAARTRRRMAGGPVPPMSAPAPVPDVGPGSVPGGLDGRSGYRKRPWLRNDPYEPTEGPVGTDPDGSPAGSDENARTNDGASGGRGRSSSDDGATDGARDDPSGDGPDDTESGEDDAASGQTISEVDDGYGNTADGEDIDRPS